MAGDALESVYQKQAGTGRAVILGSDYDPLVEAQKVNAYKVQEAAAKAAAQKAAEKERLDAMKEFDFKLKETLDADMANTQAAVKELQIRAGELSQKGYNLGDLSNPEVRQWRNDYSAVLLQNEKDNKDFLTATEFVKTYNADPSKYSRGTWDNMTRWANLPSAERPDFNSLDKQWDHTGFIKKNLDMLHENATAYSSLTGDGAWIRSGGHTFINSKQIKDLARTAVSDPDYRDYIKSNMIDVMSPEEYDAKAKQASAAGMDLYEYLAADELSIGMYDMAKTSLQGVGTGTVGGSRAIQADKADWFVKKVAGWAAGVPESGLVSITDFTKIPEVQSRYGNTKTMAAVNNGLAEIQKKLPHIKAAFIDFPAYTGMDLNSEEGLAPENASIMLRDNSNGKIAVLSVQDMADPEIAASKLNWVEAGRAPEVIMTQTGAMRHMNDWPSIEAAMKRNGGIDNTGLYQFENIVQPIQLESRPGEVIDVGSGPAEGRYNRKSNAPVSKYDNVQ